LNILRSVEVAMCSEQSRIQNNYLRTSADFVASDGCSISRAFCARESLP
jgi:hypothetical protein